MVKPLLLWLTAVFVILLDPFDAQAQSVVIDSLTSIIDKPATSNGDRIEAMVQLSQVMASQNKMEKAMKIAKESQQLSYLEADGRYGALVHARLAALRVNQDSLSIAFQALDSADWYASRTQDKSIQGLVRFRRGWLEHIIDNTDKAYQYMLEALRILEEEDAPLYKSSIYHYLAAIHGYWGDTEKQLYYSRLCLEAALSSADPDAITNAYLSMGSNYLYRFRETKDEKQLLDSSKYYNALVLKLTDSLQSKITMRSTGGIAALNMANLYYEFYPSSYKDSAELYLNKALALGREADNTEIIANSYGILSEFAQKAGDYGHAENLLLMALEEVSANTSGVLVKSRITNALSRVAEKMGDDLKALKYYKQYMNFDKELFDREKLSISQQLEAQYQSEKKELELNAAKQETAFTKKLNRYYLVLIIASLVGLFFLFRSYHFKLKASQQRQLLLISENNQARLQASLKEEETARLQTERELMQERLDRLERELLAGTLHVEEKNTLMQNLKEKLESLEGSDPLRKQIQRLLSENQTIDRGYEEIRAEFTDIHPEFIAGLQKQANNKLTRLDLKYCSYILMGLTNKEIAVKLNVAPKSIRMARYRIKQKLKLDENDKLDSFISDLGITSGANP
ncbi:helix-turn-helix transcriptional regulator [Algoriphagus resistens]|uniref:helix-turn-helix transcriptional regulator n=1 Tax=Algoriphagus resistens TaxID=1750590 RepID=UPI00071697F7|nr:LuxR C-terminal-related transcriptional regulator [Algoriphagus resistens]